MFFRIFALIISITSLIIAIPDISCPNTFESNGFYNDAGIMADFVSTQPTPYEINGVCGTYNYVHEVPGKYDTLLRVYKNLNENVVLFVFRPTQQTPDGQAIHDNRQLVPCTFLGDGCSGFVDDRFQQAFESLSYDIDSNFINGYVYGRHVIIVGHSLGGAFTIFMGAYLLEKFNIIPTLMIGLAGPFIGCEVFFDTYLADLHHHLGDKWFQVETILDDDPNIYDGTVEEYNVSGSDQIYIAKNVICGLNITSQVSDSYGMHDLRNYRSVMNGLVCDLDFIHLI